MEHAFGYLVADCSLMGEITLEVPPALARLALRSTAGWLHGWLSTSSKRTDGCETRPKAWLREGRSHDLHGGTRNKAATDCQHPENHIDRQEQGPSPPRRDSGVDSAVSLAGQH